MAMHRAIVLERIDFHITKAACSCGVALPLGVDTYSPKKQFRKLVAAFEKHKLERLEARRLTFLRSDPAGCGTLQ
jgi:hypothetical protein